MKTATFFDLIAAMRSGVRIVDNLTADRVWIMAVEKEDGSGRSWNVLCMYPSGKKEPVYWHEERDGGRFLIDPMV